MAAMQRDFMIAHPSSKPLVRLCVNVAIPLRADYSPVVQASFLLQFTHHAGPEQRNEVGGHLDDNGARAF
jgi:hypothetical protein